MEDFKKRQIAFVLQLVGLSVLLFGIHAYLLFHFAKDTTFFFPVWHIYTFHVIVTLIVYTVVNYKFSTGMKDVFILFMGMTLFKMLLAILFLLPLILSDFENKVPDVFNFFIPYFLYLFFEVLGLVKFLQKS
ncbi:hypothetical protein ITJ86_03675 [Winogradskyella sp. F6397]|uniref:Uncharacterized protein n=1 Tax=Winogradskyella marina TaxID=2785530 RepID=A0ABS0EHL8_9FLAO|nr:hypothetical protein [Winogradskyella marina]MBF8148980.1 hypothetical protein [Winogradskyella marina]